MPISADNPLVIDPKPAVKSRTLEYLWATRIILSMPDANTGIARVNFGHYDPTTGDVVQSQDQGEELYIEDLPLAVSEVPEAAAAMTAIIEAIPALRNWQNTKNQSNTVEDLVEDLVEDPKDLLQDPVE